MRRAPMPAPSLKPAICPSRPCRAPSNNRPHRKKGNANVLPDQRGRMHANADRASVSCLRFSAGDLFESLRIFDDLRFAPEAGQRLRENFLKVTIELFQAVMSPFAVTPDLNQAGFAQI